MTDKEIEEEINKLNVYIKKIDYIFEMVLDRLCRIEKHLQLYRKLDEKGNTEWKA